ncbi:MAG: insulinase family protein [Alphaproteobacteria bacterium]|nr:insulinase family protein [Alphaproteobacteria bacterium]
MSVRIQEVRPGLRLVTDRMDKVETATLGVWVEAGTRHEAPEINGVAHMLEHMAFKGTRKRSALAIAEEIENVGGHLNAYTSREHTAYYAKVLKEDAALALDIISDILQNSVFAEDELARERDVVVQEIGQAEDTPDDIIFDHFQAAAFPDQGLGRPVLGTEEIVKGLSRDAIEGYMRANYGPPRLLVAAAGNVNHEALADLVASQFDKVGGAAPVQADVAKYAGGEHRAERELEQAHVVLGLSGIDYADPDYYAISVLATLLGGGMSSRLFQEVREKRGLAYSVFAHTTSYVDGGLFSIYAGTDPQRLGELMPVLCAELVKMCEPVEAQELARARAQLKASVLMSLESTSARCEVLARQMQVFGRPIPPSEVVEKIEAVDAASVARAAKRLLSSRPTLAALGPLSKLESFESIAARLKV